MPIERCEENGMPGFRFGGSGKCYTYQPNNESSMTEARNKARAQERAAYASGFQEKMIQLMNDFYQKIEHEFLTPPDDEQEEGQHIDMLDQLDPEERMFANAVIAIAEKYGKFNSDSQGVWVEYIPQSENDNYDIGVKCQNCVFHETDKICKIIEGEIEPGGYCRLAVIPDGLVQQKSIKKVTYGRPGPGDPRKTPAKPSERRTGSSRNRANSAQSGRGVSFSSEVMSSLKSKMEDHNKKHGDTASKRATMAALKAVYRRGAGAFSVSHRPGMTRNQWAMARVNAYLYLLRNGRPSNPNYITDNDLLPSGHPRKSKKEK
jgi:hypothetical protein